MREDNKARITIESLVQVIGNMVDLHDPNTAGHQCQVAYLAKAIAEEICPEKEFVDCVFLAGQIHDIGKIVIPAEILNRRDKLSHMQQIMVKTHAQAGYTMLKAVKFPGNVAEAVFQHHERLDGSGYPQGLRGEQILREARILAVADVVQAMVSSRSYHPALSMEEVLEEIQMNQGKLYDTDVVTAYVHLVNSKMLNIS